MLAKIFTITSAVGMHARPAATLVALAGGFKSEITMRHKDKTVSLRSILGVMTLGAEMGERVEVLISGDDQEEAMQRLTVFFERELQDL